MQELGLKHGVHLGNLIQKEGPFAGQFELPRLFPHGARKGSTLMTKEFGFEQIGRKGSAVHLDEWPLPLGLTVDVLCQDLLADPGFAENQDRHVCVRNAVADAPDMQYPCVGGPKRDPGGGFRVFRRQPGLFAGPCNLPFQLLPIKRVQREMGSAQPRVHV